LSKTENPPPLTGAYIHGMVKGKDSQRQRGEGGGGGETSLLIVRRKKGTKVGRGLRTMEGGGDQGLQMILTSLAK